METFKELIGQEARNALAQFTGQQIGELKKLDKDIISGTSTLRGNTLNVHELGKDIPVGNSQPTQPVYSQPPVTSLPVEVVITQPNVTIIDTHNLTAPQSFGALQTTILKDQLELDFKVKPEDIFNRLDSIDNQNKKILSLLTVINDKLQSLSPKDIKKKN